MSDREQRIHENIKNIKRRMTEAAQRSGRSLKDISLVAVTKNVSLEDIRSAIEAGVKVLGENKVQEAKEKFFKLGPVVAWHMIGHLQTNKARIAAAIFDMVQSVDSARVADALDLEAGRLDRQQDVLVEVNVAADENKFGISPEETENLVMHVADKPNLRLRGLMAMAPYVEEPELTRPFFAQLSKLFKHLRSKLPDRVRWEVLSMGMTNDFEVAIEEGSSLVRIGTGIFENRRMGRAT